MVNNTERKNDMNFFAQELKKICDRNDYIHDPKFVGRTAVFRLTGDITGKMEFVTQGHADHYSALKLSLFNRTEGVIDNQIARLSEIIGEKNMHGTMINPHIWQDGNSIAWYGFTPTNADYSAMSETVDNYLSCFADQEISESEDPGIELN